MKKPKFDLKKSETIICNDELISDGHIVVKRDFVDIVLPESVKEKFYKGEPFFLDRGAINNEPGTIFDSLGKFLRDDHEFVVEAKTDLTVIPAIFSPDSAPCRALTPTDRLLMSGKWWPPVCIAEKYFQIFQLCTFKGANNRSPVAVFFGGEMKALIMPYGRVEETFDEIVPLLSKPVEEPAEEAAV